MPEAAEQPIAGRYEIVRTLGQGAFGRTFLARDLQGGREVAVKLLDARNRPDPKAFQLFRREADVLRAVRHHGIPEIYDSFEDLWIGAPTAFLVMEYIDGVSLARRIEEKHTMDLSEMTTLLLELLGILDYLHSRVPPILHRDIKPSNIIVRPNGFPALVDFGSVRRVFMGPDETGSTVAGTYGYMPYEQYMGQATPASDLYSLGATMLHVLTGRPPRDFMTEEGRLEMPDGLPLDQRLRGVLARLLRPSPAERFSGAREVRLALTTGSGSAAVQRTPSDGRLLPQRQVKTVERVFALPPAPRELTGATKALMREAAPSTVRLMTASDKDPGFSVIGALGFAFFCVITAGILPIVFLNIAHARKVRLKKFFEQGFPGTAVITKSELQETAFDEKLARVSYEFVADGTMHRDSDTVLPVIADRWKTGDEIPILFIPERDYDSVIVAVE